MVWPIEKDASEVIRAAKSYAVHCKGLDSRGRSCCSFRWGLAHIDMRAAVCTWTRVAKGKGLLGFEGYFDFAGGAIVVEDEMFDLVLGSDLEEQESADRLARGSDR